MFDLDVAVPSPLPQTFTYAADSAIAAGTRVLVPFGKRRLVGVVLGPGRRDQILKIDPAVELKRIAQMKSGLAIESLKANRGPRRTGGDSNQHHRQRSGQASHQRVPPAPTPEFFGSTHRSCLNGFIAKETCEVIRQILCGGITVSRIFLKTFEADHLQFSIRFRIEQPNFTVEKGKRRID